MILKKEKQGSGGQADEEDECLLIVELETREAWSLEE